MSDIAHLVVAFAVAAGILLVCLALAVGIVLIASKHPALFADTAPRIIGRILRGSG